MRHIFNRIKQKIRNNSNDRGSVVIEASISLTAFMFLVITLLTLVNACIVQARVGVALHEAAKEFSEYGYVYSLFGFNDEQKKYYEELSGYRMDIDDAIGAMGDTKEALDTIAGIDPLSDSAWDDWNSSLDTLEESGQKYEKIYENIKADPGEYFLGMGKVALNEGFEFFKGTVAGQFIAKGLMYKHLREDSKQDPNLFLRRHGVKDGLSGLKLYNSTVFTNGTDDIAFICQYKIRMVRLLNIDVEYEVCQLAKTKAWTGNALVRDKDNDPTNNDSSDAGSTEDSGEDSSDSGDSSSSDDGSSSSDSSSTGSSEEGEDDPSEGSTEEEGPSDSSDEGSTEETPEDEEDAAYKAMRKKMVAKYGEDVVADLEKEYADEINYWDESTWSLAAIIYAYDHNRKDILDADELAEYEQNFGDSSSGGSKPDFGGCFVAGTKVKTFNGNKNIEDVEIGDWVYSFDELTNESKLRTVVDVYVHEISDIVQIEIDDEVISATNEHPFYVLGQGFKPASELLDGEELVLLDGSSKKIDSINYRHVDAPIKVYNFEVQGLHTYYVSESGFLVHNICSQRRGDGTEQNPYWTPHGYKHFPDKNKSWKEIVKSTKNGGAAKYSPDIENIEELERYAWENGTPDTTGKNFKVIKFDRVIGASEGKETCYMRVEYSGGTIHGHPISEAEYKKRTK